MSTNVTLYKCTAEPERLDKSDYVTQGITYTGTFKGVVSSTDPVIELADDTMSNVFSRNYAFVSAFNRWYFITKAEVVSTGLYRVYLHVDVLNTWKAKILATEAFVERNEEDYNELLQDSSIPLQARSAYTTIEFPNTPFSNSPSGSGSATYNIVLTAIRAQTTINANEEVTE